MSLNTILEKAVEKDASDVFIAANAPVSAKIQGEITPLTSQVLTEEQSRQLVTSLMEEKDKKQFEEELEANFAYVLNKDVRFRVNAHVQRDRVGCVMRKIETRIPTIDELELPEILKELVSYKRGLVFFVGATGTGKSTSLAAMVGYRNQNMKGHIITIEDPIEFIHEHGKSLVMQREVGSDTHSFDNALKNTLRQAPDVILVGEIRTAQSMEHALAFAETGHLVLTTLHANNANQAIERILHFFPEERHAQVRMDLSLNLRGIVAQRLVRKPDGKSRKAILEILLNTPRVADLIKRGDIHELKDTMKKGETQGMMTFDRALVKAVQEGEITQKCALENADSLNEVRLALKLSEKEKAASKAASAPETTPSEQTAAEEQPESVDAIRDNRVQDVSQEKAASEAEQKKEDSGFSSLLDAGLEEIESEEEDPGLIRGP